MSPNPSKLSGVQNVNIFYRFMRSRDGVVSPVRCNTSRIDIAPIDNGTDNREQACGAVLGLLIW